jgi:hypothetical protein
MQNMKTVGQRNLKLLGGHGKTNGLRTRRRPEGETDGRTDKPIPVYLPYNSVVRGYKKTQNLVLAIYKFKVHVVSE